MTGAAGRRAGEGGKALELTAGFTPTSTVLVLLGVLVAGWLVYYGYGNMSRYPSTGMVELMLLLVVLPMAVGLLIVLMLFFAWLRAKDVTITVRKEGLKYVGGEVFFDAKWSRLTYVASSRKVKGLRSIIIGTNETKVRVDDLFLPSFDRLVGFLENVMNKIEGARGDRDIEI